MIITRCEAVQGVWKHDGGGRPGDEMFWTESWSKFLDANDFPNKSARLFKVRIYFYTIEVFRNRLNVALFNLKQFNKKHYHLPGRSFREGRGKEPGPVGGRRLDTVYPAWPRQHHQRQRRRHKSYKFYRFCSSRVVGRVRNEASTAIRPQVHPEREAGHLLRPERLSLILILILITSTHLFIIVLLCICKQLLIFKCKNKPSRYVPIISRKIIFQLSGPNDRT